MFQSISRTRKFVGLTLALVLTTSSLEANASVVSYELFAAPVSESSPSVEVTFRLTAEIDFVNEGDDTCLIDGQIFIGGGNISGAIAEDGTDYLSGGVDTAFDDSILQATGSFQRDYTFTLPIVGDQLVEPREEQYSLTYEPQNSLQGFCFGQPIPSIIESTGLILDDDVLEIAFEANSVEQPESQGAVNVLVAVVNPQDAPQSFQAGVVIQTTSGSAIVDEDFVQVAQNFDFSLPLLSQNISVSVIDDEAVEADETFAIEGGTVTAVDGSGFPILAALSNSVTVTILNDDIPDRLAISSPSVTVAENAVNALVSVVRSGSLAGPVSVNYATTAGTAVAGSDFQAASGTLNFADGEAGPLTITIALVDDALHEQTEEFELFLSAPVNAELGVGNAIVEITDDDTDQLGFTLASQTIDEAAGSVTLGVTRVGAALEEISVVFATTDGTASGGTDFTTTTGTLIFPAGELGPLTITVPVTDDAIDEVDETFQLTLSAPVGPVTLTQSTTTVSIRDDDEPAVSGSTGIVMFLAPSLSVDEDSGSLTINVTRQSGTAGPVSVDYSAAAGTAGPGDDYLLTPGTLSWADGEAGERSFTVSIVDDVDVEEAESFSLELTNFSPVGAAGLSPSMSITINDNDVSAIDGVINFVSDSVTVNEADGSVDLEVARSGTPTGLASIDWSTTADSAVDGDDFVAASGTLVWQDGDSTNKTISVELVSDIDIEGVEEFSVGLLNAQGATAGDTLTAIVSISDVGVDLAEIAGLSEEQAEIAAVLDNSCANLIANSTSLTADQQDLLFICGTLRNGQENSAQASAAIDAVSGDELIVGATSTAITSGLQNTAVSNRLSRLRSGNTGSFDVSGLAIEVDGQYLSGAVLKELMGALTGGAASGDDAGNDSEFGRLSYYVNGRLDFGEKNEDEPNGYDFDAQMFMFGADYRLRDNLFVGAAVSYEMADVKFAQGGGLDVGGWKGSIYGGYFSGESFYLDAQASYGRSDYDSERRIQYDYVGGSVDRTADGDTTGDQIALGIGSGFDFNRGRLTFGPNVALSFIDVGVKSFSESGAGGLNLDIGHQQQQSLTLTTGAHLSYVFNTKFGVLIPNARVDYIHEFLDAPEFSTVRFSSDPLGNDPSAAVTSLRVQAEVIDPNYLLWSVGTSAQFVRGFSGYLNYQSAEGYSGLKLQQVAYGFRYEKAF